MATLPKALRSYDLVNPRPPVKRRLILTLEGGTGVGKSTLTFRTAPRPLLHFNMDNNIEPWEESYTSSRDIYIKHVEMPVDGNREECMEVYRPLKALYKEAVRSEFFRTIHIDTGEKLWELVRRAYLGTTEFGKVDQARYDIPNANMRMFFALAKQHRINLVISHHTKEEVIRKGKRTAEREEEREYTGNKVLEGWKHTKEESHVHLLLDKDPKWKEGSDENGNVWDPDDISNKFTATIIKCNGQTALEGTVFRGDAISFPVLGTTVYPGSDWGDWI